MDPLRSEAPADQYHERIDDITGEVWLCKGDNNAATMDNVTPLVKLTQQTTFVGQTGNTVGVDTDGAASVNVQNMAEITATSRPTPALNWQVLIDGSTQTTGFAGVTLVPQLTMLGIVANSLGGALLMNPDNWPCAAFIFGGTDGAEETVNYRVSRIYEVNMAGVRNYMAIAPATGVATFGDATCVYGNGGTAFGTATNFWADTVSETNTVSGSLVFSNASQCIAMLLVDFIGAQALLMETDLGTAASADVFGAPCDRLHHVYGT